MKKTIGILDYGSGNIQSIINAFECLKAQIVLVKPYEIDNADALVLPGVGSFENISKNLMPYKKNLLNYLKSGRPFLGICIGLQYLFEESCENGLYNGLGFFKGKIKKLSAKKLPQIGWNSLEIKKQNPLLEGLDSGCFVYYVNSYAASEENALATSIYGKRFAAVVGFESVFATQFHPEKSGMVGLKILKNFIKVVETC